MFFYTAFRMHCSWRFCCCFCRFLLFRALGVPSKPLKTTFCWESNLLGVPIRFSWYPPQQKGTDLFWLVSLQDPSKPGPPDPLTRGTPMYLAAPAESSAHSTLRPRIRSCSVGGSELQEKELGGKIQELDCYDL